MGTPTNSGGESSTKSLRCSTDVHERIMALVDERGWNVDTSLRHLLDIHENNVRIPMMDGQRERWERAAAGTGMPLPVWVVARVESAMHYGSDRGTIEKLYTAVEEIRQHFGIGAAP